jgi:hypothetical protein
MVTQAALGGIYTALPTGTIGTGTVLTANGSTITQIDALLLQMWNASQMGPTDIWVNAQQLQDMSNKLFSSSGSTAQIRYALDMQGGTPNAGQMKLAAGVVVGYYLNRFSMGGPELLPVKLHPWLPSGTIVFTTSRLPYPNTNVPEVWRVRGQLDYHEIAWGPFTRSAEYGVYLRATLQVYAPFAFACLTNVSAG